MVITVTPNTAIDQTIRVNRLLPGTVHRAIASKQNAGGKGINVSSYLADWGTPTKATGFLGDNASGFESLFAQKNIEDHCIRVSGTIRTNIKIVDEHETTDINLPGFRVAQDDLENLIDKVVCLSTKDSITVLAGSLPPGTPDPFYREIIAPLNQKHSRTILDADGLPLTTVLNSSDLPYCVKPNTRELSCWAGRSLESMDDILDEALRLKNAGVKLVAVSMGGNGAVFVRDDEICTVKVPVVSSMSTVGAGDAMVAGICAALIEGGDIQRIASLSSAFSLSKLSCHGPNLPSGDLVEAAAKALKIEHRERR